MHFDFDVAELSDVRNWKILVGIVKAYRHFSEEEEEKASAGVSTSRGFPVVPQEPHIGHPSPTTEQTSEWHKRREHIKDVISGPTWPTKGAIDIVTPFSTQPLHNQPSIQAVIYDEHGPAVPGPMEPITPAATVTESTVSRRGRPKKTVAQEAAELHAALQTPLPPTPLEEAIAVAEAQEILAKPAVDDFGLMDMLGPTTPPPPPPPVSPLITQVRELMVKRGHVWMTNVLNAHKKVAKSMAEYPEEVLKAILDNPDQYNNLV